MARKEEQLTFVFDIDGTICPIKKPDEKYEDLVPYEDVVNKIRAYHKEGSRIVLFTSRNMRTYDGNLGLINTHTAPILLSWLAKWNVPYDEIIYGKPWPGKFGFYVDDRAVRPDEFMNHTLDELSAICKKSRLCADEVGDK